ncbi:MAG: response regulator [Treponema sp.]|jgi:putative two-component system response regulator|nr:response regulator [Treponema sp.]
MKKILLVDDSAVDLAAAENLLKDKYETFVSKSGREALCHLSNGLIPDLILLDIIMPEMDGWDMLISLKGISMLWDVPIVFLTSLDNEADKERAASLGAAGFITKPYSKQELLQQIETLMEKKPKKII